MLKSRLPKVALELNVVVDRALKSGAEAIAEDARQRVPVASGKLRDAIHVETESDGTYVVAGDDDTWYGHMVEYGTSHSPPHPFLVPALEENRDVVVNLVRVALRRL